MKTYLKIALAVVSVIALTGILFALYLYNKKAPDMAKEKPDFIISASALQREFEDDENAATNRYTDKILEVTGIIGSVKPTDNNSLTITLLTGSDFSSVICTFPLIADPLKFSKGREIKLRGLCSGYLMDVLLNNCALLE